MEGVVWFGEFVGRHQGFAGTWEYVPRHIASQAGTFGIFDFKLIKTIVYSKLILLI